MYTSIFLIATALSYVTATVCPLPVHRSLRKKNPNSAQPGPQATTVPTGPFFLGSACSTSSQCLGGAQCYAVNSMLIPTCSSAEAPCTSDAQCATNTCVNGLCNGPVAPTLPLGTMCYESAQCAGGASCYAVNSMEIPRCGNLEAACSSDSQCAYNTCVNDFCNGPLSSSSASSGSASTSTSISTPASATSSSFPSIYTIATLSTACTGMTTVAAPPSGTGTGTISMTGNSTMPSATQTPTMIFQGDGGEKLRAGFGGVVVASAIAFALMIAV